MAILRSYEGKFYEIPDDELSKLEMSPDKVSNLMQAAGPGGPEGGGGPGGDVDPYGVHIRFGWGGWGPRYCGWRNRYCY